MDPLRSTLPDDDVDDDPDDDDEDDDEDGDEDEEDEDDDIESWQVAVRREIPAFPLA